MRPALDSRMYYNVCDENNHDITTTNFVVIYEISFPITSALWVGSIIKHPLEMFL
jgi:hypothetical protein